MPFHYNNTGLARRMRGLPSYVFPKRHNGHCWAIVSRATVVFFQIDHIFPYDYFCGGFIFSEKFPRSVRPRFQSNVTELAVNGASVTNRCRIRPKHWAGKWSKLREPYLLSISSNYVVTFIKVSISLPNKDFRRLDKIFPSWTIPFLKKNEQNNQNFCFTSKFISRSPS